MEKQIEFDEGRISYTLKVSTRAKRLRLAIYGDGAFVVTAPQSMVESTIEKFITQKSQWIIDKLEYFKKFSVVHAVKKSGKKDFIENKVRALVLAKERLEYFNKFYGFNFNKVNVRNQKTRWGSCSTKRNLNFNYKIALIPPHLSDYIIVHELCHLEEFNHSKKFWDLVARAIPNHIELRNELKKQGVSFY